jgi:hypothetical protein
MDIRTMYLKNSKNRPAGCIVTRLSEDKKSVSYQVSTCNPRDSYNKVVGRAIAVGRLDLKPIELSLDGEVLPTRYNILRKVLTDVCALGSNALPFGKRIKGSAYRGVTLRLARAAELWLLYHAPEGFQEPEVAIDVLEEEAIVRTTET